MSGLRSVVEELRAETLAELPDALVEEDFAEVQRAAEQLEVERLRRLAELDRRRVFERDGYLSAASWLVGAFRVGWGAAREQVRLARSLEHMARTRRAVEDGDVSLSGVRVLAAAREADPEAFDANEQTLVEAARIHSVADLGRVVAYWRQAVQAERASGDDEEVRARRRLHASVTLHGMVRVDGDLDPETGESLLTALGAVMDAEARSATQDERTPAQRRADALGEVCRQWLDRADRPTVAGERPHLTVTVGADALAGGSGSMSELDHTGPVTPRIARRIACDASVMRVLLSARSEPLDVGRRTAVIPPAMRRAVVVRDRHCRFPGCDRPHTWCDAHHVRHWADGGPTAAHNLLLLCRRHHTAVHDRGGFRLELVDGGPVFRRPDGSVLEDRAPP
ncbi:MAG: DUF222 domain-containing protein [Actinomycetota bacterium]